MDPVTRLIAHHPGVTGIAVELGLVALVAVALGWVWWRGRRLKSSRRPAEMRDDHH